MRPTQSQIPSAALYLDDTGGARSSAIGRELAARHVRVNVFHPDLSQLARLAPPLLLAVFGDLHGQLAAAYDAVAHWEHHHDEQIDAVLQTGDLGAIHDARGIDGATFRHFLQDPTELGGLLYLHGILEATHPTYFVRGNHEDFDHLLEHKSEAVDPAGKLVHLWATDPIELEGGDGTTCRIAGLGGIDGSIASKKRQRERAGRQYFHQEELDALTQARSGDVDILLTHDGPQGRCLKRDPDAGSETIREVIEHLQPRFAFFGHYGDPPGPFTLGDTSVIPTEGAGPWSVPGRHAAMGILDTSNWSFRYVEPFEVEQAPPDCQHCIDAERVPELVQEFLDEQGIAFTPEEGWNPPEWLKETEDASE